MAMAGLAFMPQLILTPIHGGIGKEFDGAHDAMEDVRACRDVYYELHPLPKVDETPAAPVETPTQ